MNIAKGLSFLVVVLLAGLFSSGARGQEQRILLDLRQPLNYTGIDVTEGQTIDVTTFGATSWTLLGCQGACITTPDGIPCADEARQAPQLPCGALIGQIGEGEPFLVGKSRYGYVAPHSGPLLLAINDSHSADYRVTPYVAVSGGGVAKPGIFYLGEDITSGRQSVAAGRQVFLLADVPGTVQSQSWAIAGQPVAGFEETSGRVIPLDTSHASVVFYWIDAPAAKPVDVSFTYSTTTDPTPRTLHTSFDVKPAPAPAVTVRYGQPRPDWVYADAGGGHASMMSFGNPATDNPGIRIDVSPPNQPGRYEWVQVIESDTIEGIDTDGKLVKCTTTPGLDHIDHQGSIRYSPSWPLTGYRSLKRNFSATTFLMWEPLTVMPHAIAVPIGFVKWAFTESSSAAQSTWTEPSVMEMPTAGFVADTTRYPTWTTTATTQGHCP